ncbi:hypothetical protein ACCAA_1740002 [Candidatus Accumulibacter aalborgensis]|uniref:Uncharacterized protein n=1 Tax=Candidatus Accumulibacter aalborgensis TaxID=1860102 RepID=A0A1A8XL36_9PROT|nr:hypothetical protein ACCAA_1740002 [Candidatus Accumulibacter aalborgensis]
MCRWRRLKIAFTAMHALQRNLTRASLIMPSLQIRNLPDDLYQTPAVAPEFGAGGADRASQGNGEHRSRAPGTDSRKHQP